uniref:Uncharacterized protein n=1 Tax=Tetradesmus obliquus TaxID=3088 RepID=A0A383V1Q6_TETOB|eukprot:jgi/Sobl393_1/4579/SZX59465.1
MLVQALQVVAAAAAAAAAAAGTAAAYLYAGACTAWRDESAGWTTDLPAGDAALGIAWDHDGTDTGSCNLTQAWADVTFEQPAS